MDVMSNGSSMRSILSGGSQIRSASRSATGYRVKNITEIAGGEI